MHCSAFYCAMFLEACGKVHTEHKAFAHSFSQGTSTQLVMEHEMIHSKSHLACNKARLDGLPGMEAVIGGSLCQ